MNTNIPAFPGGEHYFSYDLAGNRTEQCKPPQQKGMTLRDYFAAKAMQSLIVNQIDCTVEALANRAYKVADAMLEIRNRP